MDAKATSPAEDESARTDSEASSEEEEVEQLAAGRERRKTQGNRYASLLAQEADQEDDLGLLFQEEGEDEEFEDPDAEVEEGSDAADDSETDDEDQGPAAGQDDLEGEKQLARESRAAKQAEKRKMDKTFSRTAGVRKKVKIAEPSTTPADPAANVRTQEQERARKRQERLSRLPADGAVRTSSRMLSVQNKERTLASMKENEEKRKHQLVAMREARKKKQAGKLQPMTQAERLKEAAEVERINSKSVSRWEAMEADRAAKQKQRLDALQNRKLEGPVIRWCSRKSEWVDGKLNHPAVLEVEDEHPKAIIKGRKAAQAGTANPTHEQKDQHRGDLEPKNDEMDAAQTPQPEHSSPSSTILVQRGGPPVRRGSPAPKDGSTPQEPRSPNEAVTDTTPQLTLDGDTKNAATITSEPSANAGEPTTIAGKIGAPEDEQVSTSDAPPEAEQANVAMPSSALHSKGEEPPSSESHDVESPAVESPTAAAPSQVEQSSTSEPLPPPSPPRAPVIEISARNTVTLMHFDPDSIRDPSIQRHVLLKTPLPTTLSSGRKSSSRTMNLPTKPVQPICVVTSQPARYRDPRTGLPYAHLDAYRAISKVVKGTCVWSGLLGAWAGAHGVEANGVPTGFRASGEGINVAPSVKE